MSDQNLPDPQDPTMTDPNPITEEDAAPESMPTPEETPPPEEDTSFDPNEFEPDPDEDEDDDDGMDALFEGVFKGKTIKQAQEELYLEGDFYLEVTRYRRDTINKPGDGLDGKPYCTIDFCHAPLGADGKPDPEGKVSARFQGRRYSQMFWGLNLQNVQADLLAFYRHFGYDENYSPKLRKEELEGRVALFNIGVYKEQGTGIKKQGRPRIPFAKKAAKQQKEPSKVEDIEV